MSRHTSACWVPCLLSQTRKTDIYKSSWLQVNIAILHKCHVSACWVPYLLSQTRKTEIYKSVWLQVNIALLHKCNNTRRHVGYHTFYHRLVKLKYIKLFDYKLKLPYSTKVMTHVGMLGITPSITDLLN